MSSTTHPRKEDETEALLDKMSKDSFPASDPPSFTANPTASEKRELGQKAPQSAAVAHLSLGEELDGAGPQQTLVLGGSDAVVLNVVADHRRLQIALPHNPLEVDVEDLGKLIGALQRIAPRLREDPPA